ncbi:FkbM family methyltransferase [Candidatus Pelagibacter ubique]|nr:FkbM family methyltransferase [Candidatus Pelagibacter ubique]
MKKYLRHLFRKPYYYSLNFLKKFHELICFFKFFFLKEKIISIITQNKVNFFDIGSLNGIVDLKVKNYSYFFDFFGFDPNNGSYPGYKKIFNTIIDHKEGKKIFYTTKIPDLSSTLKPNYDFQKNYHDLKKFEIKNEKEINCDFIDNISLINNLKVDFLKIDTQGTALSVLRGSEKNLKESIIGLEIEVEFQETYIDQDIYIEICEYLNKLNFETFDILDISRWEYKDSFFYGDPRERSCGRLVYANFLFFKKFSDIDNCIQKKKDDESKNLYLKKTLNILLAYEKIDSVKFLCSKYYNLLSPHELRCYDVFAKSISFKKKRKKFAR